VPRLKVSWLNKILRVPHIPRSAVRKGGRAHHRGRALPTSLWEFVIVTRLFAPEKKFPFKKTGMKNDHGGGEYGGGASPLSIRIHRIVAAQVASILWRLLDGFMPKMYPLATWN